MDWQTILTIGAMVLFAFLMLRGCGGMMGGGGCGHSPAPRGQSPHQMPEESEPVHGGSKLRS